MKRLHFAVGLLTALACSGLEAQTKLRAEIPFDFQMGKTSFPAGNYIFQASTQMLVMQEADGQRSSATALTMGVWREKKAETGILEFNLYNDKYFLAKVWVPGSTEGSGLPKTSSEKELARRATPMQTEAVLLRTK